MTSFSDDNQTNAIDGILLRHLTQRLDIKTIFLILRILISKEIYPHELQLNKVSTSDTDDLFWIYIYLFLAVLFPPKFMINA